MTPRARPLLTPGQLEAMRSQGIERRFEVGDRLISIGAESSEVFYLVAGVIKIVVVSPEGIESVFGLRHPGEFIGEMSTLTNERRSADAIVVEPTTAIMLSAAQFSNFLERFPAVALHLLRMQTRRLDEMTNRAMLGSRSVKARIAQRLLELAADSPSDREVRLTQADLALYINASREWTSKALGELRRAGAIRTTRGRVIVLDHQILSDAAIDG